MTVLQIRLGYLRNALDQLGLLLRDSRTPPGRALAKLDTALRQVADLEQAAKLERYP